MALAIALGEVALLAGLALFLIVLLLQSGYTRQAVIFPNGLTAEENPRQPSCRVTTSQT